MSERIEVRSKQEAWEKVSTIFPTDYDYDEGASQRAGYDIYRHLTLNYYNRICDLGCRLEVLTGEYGEDVTNIWVIEKGKPEVLEFPTKEQIRAAAAGQFTFEPERVQLIRIFATGYAFEDAANRAVYKAMRNNELYRSSIASDMVEAYCEDKGIEWGSIRVISTTHYENSKNGGHYVIEAIVGARLKN